MMNLAESFPILKDYTYLNTANSGILSTDLAQWRRTHDEAFIKGGSVFRMENAPIIDELRTNIADFFQGEISRTFLTPNFSFGFNTLIDGLARTHRFLLLNEEYPSVAYPVISRGFEHHFIDIDENLEANVLAAIEKFKPTVFAFSVVQYISGYRMRPKFIRELKENYPDLLLIGDGTQFCGTVPIHFNNSGLDALLTSGYKWLLSGYGNGFVLISEQLANNIYNEKKQFPLPALPFLKGKALLAYCFEPGHLDTLNFGSLNEGIKLIKKIGIEAIEAHTQALASKARIALFDRGLIPEFLVRQQDASTIMSMQLDNNLVQQLQHERVVCSPRGTGTRISFHFYNTEEDLQKLLSVLDGKRT
ncbi:aminotransferase class V-fold PLP-dependent enzyme [Pedobacter sandarakinus]|uniref:aminotransferase class V-fold PLP-dependent enzyme n=1 Tax=Pedobacter sandarakinus TaxID=353156 RepID=UPI002248676C|nr:aminotransferase class V-fold PLP-dependent enzyme [Pedobacter sandarakinus]MCX2574910.1 aminotransferase class V-fold PLP-dependent enzyme [Pedobacter sandarakinus]